MAPKFQTYHLTMRDKQTDQAIVLLDGVVGTVEAAKQLGISQAQFSRLARGKCTWGPKNSDRFVYEFKVEPDTGRATGTATMR